MDHIFDHAPSVEILHIKMCIFCIVISLNLKELRRKWSQFILGYYPVICLE